MGRGFRGRDDLLVRCVEPAVADIFHDRTVEQPRVLQDHADVLSECTSGNVCDRMPVNSYLAAVHVVEPHQKLHDGRLSGSGRADDGYHFAGSDVQTEVVDDLFAREIAETDVLKAHRSVDTGEIRRLFRIRCLLRLGKVGLSECGLESAGIRCSDWKKKN